MLSKQRLKRTFKTKYFISYVIPVVEGGIINYYYCLKFKLKCVDGICNVIIKAISTSMIYNCLSKDYGFEYAVIIQFNSFIFFVVS